MVQSLHISSQLVPQRTDLLRRTLPLLRRRRLADLKRRRELLHHGGLVALVGVKFETERLKPHLFQPLVHDIERGLLLGDEKHPAPDCQIVGDHVRDRLGLARSGRAIQDERLSERGIQHGRQLRRVRADGAVQLSRLEMLGYFAWREDFDSVVELAARADEVVDERALLERLRVLHQVAPHGELAEGEMPDGGAVDDLDVLRLLYALAEDLHDVRHVESGIVQRQRVQPRHLDPVLCSKELEQRRIDNGLVVTLGDADSRVRRRLADPNRHKDQRRFIRLRIAAALGVFPAQEPDGGEERVHTRLFKVVLSELVQSLHGSDNCTGAILYAQPVAGEFRLHDLVEPILRELVRLEIRHVLCGERLDEGADRHLLPRRKPVLQRSRIWAADAHDVLGFTRIEELVRRREVEKLLRPHGHTARRCYRLLELGDVDRLDLPQRPHAFLLHVVAVSHKLGVLCGIPDCQRHYTAHSRCNDVYRAMEVAVPARRKTDFTSGLLCLLESLVARDHRSLDGDELICGDQLSEDLRISRLDLRQMAFDEEASHKGVPADYDDHRMQLAGLHYRGEQNRRVETRRHLVLEHRVRHPDLLPRQVEAGRRVGIRNAFLLDRTVHRRAHLEHVLPVHLVTGQGGVAASDPLHFLGDLRLQLVNGLAIGLYERRKEHRQRPYVVRLVRRQRLNLVVVAEERLVARQDLDPERSVLGILQLAEECHVVHEGNRTKLRFRFRPEGTGLHGLGLEEVVEGADAACQAFHLLRRDVLHLEACYQRALVLSKGEVQVLAVLYLHRHAALDVELRPFVLEEKSGIDAAKERRKELLVQQIPISLKHRRAWLFVGVRIDVPICLLCNALRDVSERIGVLAESLLEIIVREG